MQGRGRGFKSPHLHHSSPNDRNGLRHSLQGYEWQASNNVGEECPSKPERPERKRMAGHGEEGLSTLRRFPYTDVMHFVYLLRLSSGNYYVGETQNVERRLMKHQNGEVPSTAKYRPVDLAWYGGFEDKRSALRFEKYLKTASGKAFRNARLLS